MDKGDIRKIKETALKKLSKVKDLDDLDNLEKYFFGKKKGLFKKIFEKLSKIKNLEERKNLGKLVNKTKEDLILFFQKKRKEVEQKIELELLKKEEIDVTLPGKKVKIGHLHPLTQALEKIEEIFQSLGFLVVEGPEIENEWYNFDALNIPKDHPARDLWDTLWLKLPPQKTKKGSFKLLLRTHTSSVQVRYMQTHNPPLAIIVPGRVFRYEATDSTHEINFYQVEGLLVDNDVSVANFKAVIEEFFKRFFNKKIKIRLRPSFFPFTEPSFEVDIALTNKKNQEWLEVMGAGMVHPEVFKSAGLIPRQYDKSGWQGFAFGLGLERLVMIKHKITDIRLFYENDLRFLNQF